MKTLEKIVKPYKNRLDELDYKSFDNSWNPNVFLFQKWAYKVGRGWYGFSLDGAPFVWARIIDDFLTEVEKECPNFEIHQIKLKFSSIRCYLELNSEDKRKIKFVNEQIDKLENFLQNDALYY